MSTKAKLLAAALAATAALWAALTYQAELLGMQEEAASKLESRRAELAEEPKPRTDVEKWRDFLREQTAEAGLGERDYAVLDAVVSCESSWRQFRPDGSVVVSSGNVGLGQINVLAHRETYEAAGLDPYDPYDNLRFVVFLYQRDGLEPWRKWSGHCWEPKVETTQQGK